MRSFFSCLVVGLALAGCGGAEDRSSPSETTGEVRSEISIKERWCNSYTSAQFCPKNVCVWVSTPAPGKCTLPPTE
jgi:uncharacterized protein YceK